MIAHAIEYSAAARFCHRVTLSVYSVGDRVPSAGSLATYNIQDIKELLSPADKIVWRPKVELDMLSMRPN
jgi:hypothetical protein